MKKPPLSHFLGAALCAALATLPSSSIALEESVGNEASMEQRLKREWSLSPRPVVPTGSAITEQDASRSEERTAALLEAGPNNWRVALSDRTIYHTLRRWSSLTGWQLSWEIDRDFPIEVQVDIQGRFDEAVGKVMLALADTDYPLQAILNPETRVLRVTRYLNSKAN